ncbi:hypothetical protein ALC60_02061 [Trachymyrmex zeteki]|uniref:Uncharacterized protein n=1 Tax=Mycetomoellerius zeteki TaxID=64791 RepID=A0A151XEZ8_9HYME|nr:hypothetical protein ALC60_02061 [Trachymyrmex zeteki]
MRCVVQKRRTTFAAFPIRQFEVMRIVLPRTRYWEGPEKEQTGRDRTNTKNKMRCHAGTREMIAGPVR